MILGHHLVVAEILHRRRTLLFVGIHAQQNIVRYPVVLIDIVRIVGRDDLDVVLPGKLDQHFVGFDLLGNFMALKLNVIVFAEQVEPPLEFNFAPASSPFLRMALGRRHQCSR